MTGFLEFWLVQLNGAVFGSLELGSGIWGYQWKMTAHRRHLICLLNLRCSGFLILGESKLTPKSPQFKITQNRCRFGNYSFFNPLCTTFISDSISSNKNIHTHFERPYYTGLGCCSRSLTLCWLAKAHIALSSKECLSRLQALGHFSWDLCQQFTQIIQVGALHLPQKGSSGCLIIAVFISRPCPECPLFRILCQG